MADNLPVIYGTSAIKHPDGVVERAERMLIGRTPKIDEEKVLVILRGLKNGSTVAKACEEAGISKATFYVWKQVNPSFLDAVERTRRDWTDSMVDKGLNQLQEVQADSKEDNARVRKAECIARHTLEIASRLNPDYSAKKETRNINVNVDVSPVDLSKYLNK